jgi:TPR repeat protein
LITILGACQTQESTKRAALIKKAESGDAMAQCELGDMYRKLGWDNGCFDSECSIHSKDYAEAVRWYRKAAEQGHAQSQYGLGLMYTFHWGVPKDDAEAVRWYRKAAEQGLAEAQWSLSVAYANGKGVPKDHAEFTRWLDKAEEQKDALAQRDLWPGVCQRAVNQPDPKPQRNN